jgi:hypothetical protein
MSVFYVGQIVISDFSGPSRQMYWIEDDDLRSLIGLFHPNDVGIILKIHHDDGRNRWLKLLTSAGVSGYVPSIWIRSV